MACLSLFFSAQGHNEHDADRRQTAAATANFCVRLPVDHFTHSVVLLCLINCSLGGGHTWSAPVSLLMAGT